MVLRFLEQIMCQTAMIYLLMFRLLLIGIIPLFSLKDPDLNWNVEGWREFLGFPDEDDFLSRIRANAFSGKPLIAQELVAFFEKVLRVSLGIITKWELHHLH